MEKNKIKVLLIEDNIADSRLVEEFLKDSKGIDFKIEVAKTIFKGVEQAFEGHFDVVLLDLGLPDSQGLDTFFKVQSLSPYTPIIVLTGLDDEKLAMEAVQKGAQDYLVKGLVDSNLLIRSICYAIERKRAQESLQESEKKYRSLFECSPEGVVLVGLDGLVRTCNAAMADILGMPREDIEGKHFFGLGKLDNDYVEQYLDSFAKVFDGEDVNQFEIETTLLNGKKTWMEIFPSSIKKGDEVTTVQVIAKDISQRKKIEEELLQSRKMASIGQLAAGVAHEINTPLTNISLLSANIMNTTDDPRIIKKLNALSEQRRSASKIVESLLNFSRKVEPKYEVVNLNKVLSKSITSLEIKRPKNVKVVRDFQKNLPKIKIDPEQSKQAFMNIIQNAYWAMPKGGELTISTNPKKDGQVELRFTDTGIGIPKKYISRVFDPFFTKKEDGKGTGLGLSICHGIIQAHKGKIDVESEEGKGTTFTVKLPGLMR